MTPLDNTIHIHLELADIGSNLLTQNLHTTRVFVEIYFARVCINNMSHMYTEYFKMIIYRTVFIRFHQCLYNIVFKCTHM